jgi:hypothetical protein
LKPLILKFLRKYEYKIVSAIRRREVVDLQLSSTLIELVGWRTANHGTSPSYAPDTMSPREMAATHGFLRTRLWQKMPQAILPQPIDVEA